MSLTVLFEPMNKYTGTIPERKPNNESQRALAVWHFLNFTSNTMFTEINENFIPKLNTLKTQLNTTIEDITAKHNTVVEKEALMNPHYNAINGVNQNKTNINAVADEIVPNITQILLADQNAQTATQKAQEAAQSAEAAQNAKNEAEAIFDNFDDRYLGPKDIAPTVDNDDDPLKSGMLYWNSVNNKMYVRDTSLNNWIDLSFIPTSHSGLTDTDNVGAHPISAITNLQSTLDSKREDWVFITKTANYTAVADNYIFADTTAGAFTITLLAEPEAYTRIVIVNEIKTNTLTIDGNGNSIAVKEDIDTILEINSIIKLEFIYTGTKWRVL